jgi:hypothetical protein
MTEGPDRLAESEYVLARADLDREGPDTKVWITGYDWWDGVPYVFVDVADSHRSYYVPASDVRVGPYSLAAEESND